jgi:hypothetical protein
VYAAPQASLHCLCTFLRCSTLPFALPSSLNKYMHACAQQHRGRTNKERKHSPSDRCTYHTTQTHRPGVIPSRATSASPPYLPNLTSASFLLFPFPLILPDTPKFLSFLFLRTCALTSLFFSISQHNGTKTPSRPPRTRAAQPVQRQHQDPRPGSYGPWGAAVRRAAETLPLSPRGRPNRLFAHKKDVVHRPPQLRG